MASTKYLAHSLSLGLLLPFLAQAAMAADPTCSRKVDTYSQNGKTIEIPGEFLPIEKLTFDEKTTQTFVPHLCGKSALIEERGLGGFWVVTASPCSLAPLRIAFWSSDAEIANAKVWSARVPVALEMTDFNSRSKVEIRCEYDDESVRLLMPISADNIMRDWPRPESDMIHEIKLMKFPELENLREILRRHREFDEKLNRSGEVLEVLKGDMLLPFTPGEKSLIRKLRASLGEKGLEKLKEDTLEMLRVFEVLNGPKPSLFGR